MLLMLASGTFASIGDARSDNLPPALGEEDESGLRFGGFGGGPIGASFEYGLGECEEYEGGGLNIYGGGVLSRVMGDRLGLEKSITLSEAMKPRPELARVL